MTDPKLPIVRVDRGSFFHSGEQHHLGKKIKNKEKKKPSLNFLTNFPWKAGVQQMKTNRANLRQTGSH